jgi:hypothetical protein
MLVEPASISRAAPQRTHCGGFSLGSIRCPRRRAGRGSRCVPRARPRRNEWSSTLWVVLRSCRTSCRPGWNRSPSDGSGRRESPMPSAFQGDRPRGPENLDIRGETTGASEPRTRWQKGPVPGAAQLSTSAGRRGHAPSHDPVGAINSVNASYRQSVGDGFGCGPSVAFLICAICAHLWLTVVLTFDFGPSTFDPRLGLPDL